MIRKINIGAGPFWQFNEWEILDNVPGKYHGKKKNTMANAGTQNFLLIVMM